MFHWKHKYVTEENKMQQRVLPRQVRCALPKKCRNLNGLPMSQPVYLNGKSTGWQLAEVCSDRLELSANRVLSAEACGMCLEAEISCVR
jgi:hypothetical protein